MITEEATWQAVVLLLKWGGYWEGGRTIWGTVEDDTGNPEPLSRGSHCTPPFPSRLPIWTQYRDCLP